MKLLKKNQIIIYVIVLMLMTAGYLNYTTNTENQVSVETALEMEASDDMKLADIGDATLVNSEDVVTENSNDEIDTNEEKNKTENEDEMIDLTQNITNLGTSMKEEKEEEETKPTSTTNGNDYFVKSKLERDTMYSQMLETYEKVLNSSNSLETQRQSATKEIQKINETKNSIMICENLIRTKGFENNIVFVNGDSISVIIGVEEMKQEEVAQVQNIIAREMKAEIENIHIATK